MGEDFLSSIGGVFRKKRRTKKSALTKFKVCGERFFRGFNLFFMRFFYLFFLKKISGNKGAFITTNCRQFDEKTNALDDKGDFGEKSQFWQKNAICLLLIIRRMEITITGYNTAASL